jgi:hypothetical protein
MAGTWKFFEAATSRPRQGSQKEHRHPCAVRSTGEQKDAEMSDKTPVPADGDGVNKGALDGVSGAPGHVPGAGVNGRADPGETGGGAYPNPHTGKSDDDQGEMKHGGQSEMKYYGSGQAGAGGSAGPNSAAGSNDPAHADEAKLAEPAVDRPAHTIHAQGRSFEVVEQSGVAAAEATADVLPHTEDPKDESKLAG